MIAAGEARARALDAADPLRGLRERFHIPSGPDGKPSAYLCGNSLGLQPKSARDQVEQELDDWKNLAVRAHFAGRRPWYSAHEAFRESGARLVGAKPGEVVMMNSLTANLHFMLASFYRPRGRRTKVLMEGPAFPSDTYAVKSHLACRGVDPAENVVVAAPRPGEETVREEDALALIAREGPRLALVVMGGVNFLTGQLFDLERLTRAAHQVGALAGWDLAHAAGNVVLRLSEWQVDFAVWCSYKYLNGGPGALGGCFVHERHGGDPALPRMAGWWGNDPATRFQMHLIPEFIPRAGADGWQVSNPPILSLAPLRASLAIFDEVGMDALRAKSERLTGFLTDLLDQVTPAGAVRVITPRAAGARGCQVSLRARGGRATFQALAAAGVTCDFREPDVIRVAPVPLYNTFHDVWRFADALARAVAAPS
ncbi:MAG: kynureninase [Planctomycetes bacterium]|nr:kynureninase [Planctomycetota bacterium]